MSETINFVVFVLTAIPIITLLSAILAGREPIDTLPAKRYKPATSSGDANGS